MNERVRKVLEKKDLEKGELKATITINHYERINKLSLESKLKFFNEIDAVFRKWNIDGGLTL